MFMFNTTSRVIYRAPEETSGYVSGDVEVICASNPNNISTQQLYTNLQKQLNTDSSSEFSIKIKTSRDFQEWGFSLKVLTFEGGMFNPSQEYYMFATSKNIYLVRKLMQSENKIVQDTIEQIFDNLQFLQ